MKSNTLALIVLIAISAFALGIVISTPTTTEASAVALLNANVLQAKTIEDEPTSVTIDELRGDMTVVNFWATWCAPCRHEMPMFQQVYEATKAQGKSFEIVGVTIDSIDKSIPMLDSMSITYPIVYAELTGNQLMEAVGNPQGLLPFTLVIDKQGNIVEQKIGRVYEEDLNNWIAAYLP